MHSSGGFSRAEIAKIQEIIEEDLGRFVEVWNDYFGS